MRVLSQSAVKAARSLRDAAYAPQLVARPQEEDVHGAVPKGISRGILKIAELLRRAHCELRMPISVEVTQPRQRPTEHRTILKHERATIAHRSPICDHHVGRDSTVRIE